MDIDRHAQGLGPGQDRLEPRIIEEAPVGRTIDQQPAEPEIPDRPPAHLLGRQTAGRNPANADLNVGSSIN